MDSISSSITSKIVSKVKEDRFVSLLAFERTAFTRQEQLVVCFRHVLDDSSIRQRFFCFALASDLTGLGLSTELLAIVRAQDIDIRIMVGQGYTMVLLRYPGKRAGSSIIFSWNVLQLFTSTVPLTA